ncbi:transcription termination factor MTERF6, chloroplastic/mitochondrial-like [Canna indica]|uniref:Transcription termination factor MTERF6, chloroplastic/mitochondrial-like n=1 Tax=Canna indica TaxID=4628 RepID=A0AAQ3QGK7_9LILI|nr:transcription termination factor MTERF6, chloroplastic/mitochondrial-like [Canna indica]
MVSFLRHRDSLLPLFKFLRVRYLSSSASVATGDGTASCNPNFMVDYLVKSCGFSIDEASKVSKPLDYVQSTEKPDAVVNFMRVHGFRDPHLRKIISVKPRLLCWDVEKNLAPKFQSLRELGLSESELVDVIWLNPCILNLSLRGSLFSKLKLWESLLGSREHLLKLIKRKTWVFGNSIENKVLPNLKFLKDECGIPEDRVALVLRMKPDFITQKLDSLRALVVRAEEMGVPRRSRMFMWVLHVLHMVSKEKVEDQFKLLRNFGCLDSELSSAVKKQPSFLGLSREALHRKMNFLVNDVGCTPSYIAQRPKLLMLSFEKRMNPRFCVMEILKSRGLWTAEYQVLHFFSVPNAKFLEKFVLPYKDDVPELLKIL